VIVPDVNVLVYAHREDAVDHPAYREWLEAVLLGDEPFGLSDLVLSGFLRVVTHPRVFKKPSPLDAALEFAAELRDSPNCVAVQPGPRHWEIFTRLCRQARVRGNLVADAFLAAMAIESGGEWITTDRDYSRFPGLRSRHPLE
jgi:toxin-antitoxin system PIN domain toxin